MGEGREEEEKEGKEKGEGEIDWNIIRGQCGRRGEEISWAGAVAML